MQTSNVDEQAQRTVLAALAAEGALQEVAEPHAGDFGADVDGSVRRRTAMHGLRVGVPLAFALWLAIGGLFWAVAR